MIFPVKGRISQPFGPSTISAEPRMWALKDAAGWRKCRPTAFAGAVEFAHFHPAVDVACPIGTAVRAPANGVLLRRETYPARNLRTGEKQVGHAIYFLFGNHILYVDHLSAFVAKEGQAVKEGGLLARTGDSGYSLGPHAHLEDRWATDPHLSWAAVRGNPERTFK